MMVRVPGQTSPEFILYFLPVTDNCPMIFVVC